MSDIRVAGPVATTVAAQQVKISVQNTGTTLSIYLGFNYKPPQNVEYLRVLKQPTLTDPTFKVALVPKTIRAVGDMKLRTNSAGQYYGTVQSHFAPGWVEHGKVTVVADCAAGKDGNVCFVGVLPDDFLEQPFYARQVRPTKAAKVATQPRALYQASAGGNTRRKVKQVPNLVLDLEGQKFYFQVPIEQRTKIFTELFAAGLQVEAPTE